MGTTGDAIGDIIFQVETMFQIYHITYSQEHEGAPIYWSRAPIYWSPQILFSIFWKRMKRENSIKTRFCVSHEGLTNGQGAFDLPWFMFENKTKNMFLERWGSNVLEPRLQYNGAGAPIYWSPSNIFFQKLKTFFLSWINPKSDRLNLIEPYLCDCKEIFMAYENILGEKIW